VNLKHVSVSKFDYFVERVTILAICLWGNWAIYYWVTVLVLDASFTSLKAFIPVLLLQIFAAIVFLLHTDLGITNASDRVCVPARRHPRFDLGKSFYILSGIVVLCVVFVVLAADHFNLTESSLTYNLIWAMLLPISLAYLNYSKVLTGESSAPVIEEKSRTWTLDTLLFILSAMAFAFTAYDSGFPSPDDAFMGHVISSTLANPGLPIQGQDLLLNTTAPYSIHPSYRPVGIEVLIALVSDVAGLNPLYIYFHILPVVGAIFWSLASYMFMRTMRTPYPGLAVAVCLIVYLFLSNANLQASAFRHLVWGKSLVLTVGAPLFFFSVAAFIRSQTIRTWLLLLLSVCWVAIWSSTSLFFIPFCVGLASIVFLPSIRTGLPVLSVTFLSLFPILVLFIYILLVLHDAPVNVAADRGAGPLMVDGKELGGQLVKRLLLVMLLILPLMARTIEDDQFQSNILRVCIVGIFTVMAPYFIETIAVLTGLNLLSVRLPTAYPAILLTGVFASIGVCHLNAKMKMGRFRWVTYQASILALISIGIFYGLKNTYYSPSWTYARAMFEFGFDEAVAVRKLIPKNSYVAAGSLDDVLPMLPEPPAFIAVRHYLDFHKYFLSESEFSNRKYLYEVLKKRLPREAESLETTVDSIVSRSDSLGVTTFVFQAVSSSPDFEVNAKKEKFVVALTARLKQIGYECSTSPSGRSRVCNRII
jgi:hypothetical protein